MNSFYYYCIISSQCVNEKSDEQPPLIEYISKRIVGDDIKLDMDPGFLACCDCKDFCQVNLSKVFNLHLNIQRTTHILYLLLK